ncbi:arsenic resistance protein [Rhizobium leguminosarum bv. viciae]|nr:arsenic resistance protein [Rhizobium leguminosarum bv. viciae]
MTLRENLESHQVRIYFGAVILGVIVALIISGTTVLEPGINPALAFMLFVTFLQVPLAELRLAFSRFRFLAALLLTNFAVVPVLVGVLVQFLPPDPIIRLGVLLVLLAPCIDYVVTFSQLGRADAKLLLAATPSLLIIQMLLLPVYLGVFLGPEAASLIKAGPFVHAFIWLIAIPLVLAVLVQVWAGKSAVGARVSSLLGLLPVPATALVLFVVVAAVVPQLGPALADTLRVMPIYVAYAVIAPLVGWGMSRLFRLEASAGRAVAFSAATRNSLVVLPLALAVPGAVPLLPAIIVTQTLVELVSELVYVRLAPKFGVNSITPSI